MPGKRRLCAALVHAKIVLFRLDEHRLIESLGQFLLRPVRAQRGAKIDALVATPRWCHGTADWAATRDGLAT